MTCRPMGVVMAVALFAGGCAVGNFVTGAPPSRSATPARGLLVRRCSGCHDTPDPTLMSPSAWRIGLDRMKLRMRLPAGEWDSLAAMSPGQARP